MKKPLFAILLLTFITILKLSAQNSFIKLNNYYKSELKNNEYKKIIRYQDPSFVDIEYYFGGIKRNKKQNNKTEFDIIKIKHFNFYPKVGYPSVPVKNQLIEIPKNCQPKIEILDLKEQIISNIYVYPTLDDASDSFGDKNPEFELNKEIYLTNNYFPKSNVETIRSYTMRGVNFLRLQINAIKFNPVKRKIKALNYIKIRIYFNSKSNKTKSITKPQKKNLFQSIFGNVQNTTRTKTKSTSKSNYVLITSDKYQNSAKKLIEWRSQLGYDAILISQKNWTVNKVRDSIRYYNDKMKLNYVAILGDHEDVPAYVLSNLSSDYLNYCSDLYYVCFDGEDDYLPDAAIGRISVTNKEQVDNVVNKIINYEKNPVDHNEFYNTIVCCAQFQDDNNDGYADRRFLNTAEDVRNYLEKKNYVSKEVYYTDEDITPKYYNNTRYSDGGNIPSKFLKSNGFKWDGDAKDIIEKLNEGTFFLMHRDHGNKNGSGWAHPDFVKSDLNKVNNTNLLPLVLSMNCHTGKFLLPDCFAEKFLRLKNKGAVGVVAASHKSYSGYNDAASIGMVNAIWSKPGFTPDFGDDEIEDANIETHDDIYCMGDIMQFGFLQMLNLWTEKQGRFQYIFEIFHFFGDPTTKIWTKAPTQILATYSTHFTKGENTIALESSNCKDGLVTLVSNGKLIAKAYLNNGKTNLSFNAKETQSKLLLTLSKHNYKPFVKTINRQDKDLEIVSNTNLGTIEFCETAKQLKLKLKNLSDQTISISKILSEEKIFKSLDFDNTIEAHSENEIILTFVPNKTGNLVEKLSIYYNEDKAISCSVKAVICSVLESNFEGELLKKSKSPYLVKGDISIANTKNLTIEPGVNLIFSGYYKIDVQGSLKALGEPKNPIVFTIKDSTNFYNLESELGGWAGIKFDNTPDSNEKSELRYCILQYAKSIPDNTNTGGCGGALYINNVSNLNISNCTIKNCMAKYGGALYCSEANPNITNNKIIYNIANSCGAGIYLKKSNSLIMGNQISFNKLIASNGSGGGVYSDNCELNFTNNQVNNNNGSFGAGIYLKNYDKSFILNNTIVANYGDYGGGMRLRHYCESKIYNNIFYYNKANSYGSQIYTYEDCVQKIKNCCIQYGENGVYVYKNKELAGEYDKNYLSNPKLFIHNGIYKLKQNSYCINKGDDELADLENNTKDIENNSRKIDASVDIGASEFIVQKEMGLTLNPMELEENIMDEQFVGKISVDNSFGPCKYEFVEGEGAEDNSFFKIENNTIKCIKELKYKESATRYFRIRATEIANSTNTSEKFFSVSILQDLLSITAKLEKISVDINAESSDLILDKYFKASADFDDITFKILNNSNKSLVKATISGNKLVLDYAKDKEGISEITLKATYKKLEVIQTFEVEVKKILGIHDSQLSKIKIYPNPAKDYIKINSTTRKASYAIYNVQGKKILSSNKIEDKIDISNLSKGVYFIRIKFNNQIETLKLVKK